MISFVKRLGYTVGCMSLAIGTQAVLPIPQPPFIGTGQGAVDD